jgi:methionyl-tRNA formyltransferase
LINGETETGLTSFFLKKKVDTGDIIFQERIAITVNDTYDSLHERLSRMAGPFLLKTLDLIESGENRPLVQDDTQASRAPKIGPFDAMIDFGLPADKVGNFVRGLATQPGAYTFFRGKKIKIHACLEAGETTDAGIRPGTIIADRKRLLVQCGPGGRKASAVELLRVVPAGKKEMDGVSFLNGFKPLPGELFGEISHGAEERK